MKGTRAADGVPAHIVLRQACGIENQGWMAVLEVAVSTGVDDAGMPSGEVRLDEAQTLTAADLEAGDAFEAHWAMAPANGGSLSSPMRRLA